MNPLMQLKWIAWHQPHVIHYDQSYLLPARQIVIAGRLRAFWWAWRWVSRHPYAMAIVTWEI